MIDGERHRGFAAFYAGVSAPQRTVERLVALAEADGCAAAAPKAQRVLRRLAWTLATAAVMASLVAIPAYKFGRRAGLAERSDCHPAVIVPPELPTPTVAASAPAGAPAVTPRLLLMEVRADWCPRTPTVIPIFRELTQKYRDEPVLFVSFDVTDEGTRRQAAYLATSLGLADVLGRRWEPGLLQLIDREQGVILEALRETTEQPRFERALTDALPAPPS